MFKAYTHQDVVSLLESIRAAIALFELREDADAPSLVSANSLFGELAEKPIVDCVGMPAREFLSGQIERQVSASLHYCLSMQAPQEVGLVTYREGKSQAWRLLVVPLIPEKLGTQRLIVGLVDIAEEKFLESGHDIARDRFMAVVDSVYDGVLQVDRTLVIREINKAARTLFGLNGEDVIGAGLARFIPELEGERQAEYAALFGKQAGSHAPVRMQCMARRTDGSEVPVEVSFSGDQDGAAQEVTLFVRDISEHVKLIEHLKQVATHDPLTGIFNRRHGAATLHSEIHRSQRYGHALTVAMIDVDHFKDINDTYGHACGDLVLNSVVTTISATLRNTDTMCRWGGEEFLVLLPATEVAEALIWAERAREAVAAHATIGYGDEAIMITASFGLAAVNQPGSTQEDLLMRVDTALYRAKQGGRNRVEVG
ncbi:MAG: diguanylate cyclase [Burkholderiaceae bacterium]|nr:diguanylate cyclase [Burkholderiaceae bacterium]